MSEQTAQEAYLAEMLGDVYSLRIETEASLQDINKMHGAITESFVGVEKSICEMNMIVEESIKKAGDKASATLALKMDAMIGQISAYLTEDAKRLRLENIEQTKKEIEAEKAKVIKETAATINRINGGNLIKPVLVFAIAFAVIFSVVTSYLTMYLAVQEIKENFTTSSTQSPSSSTSKHH